MNLDNLRFALGHLTVALQNVQNCLDLGEYRPEDLSQAWQGLEATEQQLYETRGYLMVCAIPEEWKRASPLKEGLRDAAAR